MNALHAIANCKANSISSIFEAAFAVLATNNRRIIGLARVTNGKHMLQRGATHG